MDEHHRLIEQVEQLLVRAEAMQQDFHTLTETLRQHLAHLRQVEPAAGNASPPAPPQPSAAPSGLFSKLTKKMHLSSTAAAPAAEAVPPVEGSSPDPPPAPAPAAPKRERRASPRRKGNPVSVLLAPMQGSGQQIESWVVDRSQGGVCLLVDEAIALGTQLRILPTKARAGIRWVDIEITSCRQERNSWMLGCKFLQKLSWAELQLFG